MISTVEKAGLCALCFSYLIAKSHSEFMSWLNLSWVKVLRKYSSVQNAANSALKLYILHVNIADCKVF